MSAQTSDGSLDSAIHAPPTRADIVLLAAICVGAFWVRFNLLDEPISYDEAFSYRHYMLRSLWRAMRTYDLPNNHIFHTVCGWFVVRILPLNEFTLRLPAFVSGLAVVPLTYLLGRHVSGTRTGLIAAAIVAFDHQLIRYSAEARGYVLQTALFLGALCLLPGLISDGRHKANWRVAILLALAIWTVPPIAVGIGVVVGWGAWLGWSPHPHGLRRVAERLWRPLALTAALSVFLYLSPIHYVYLWGFAIPGAQEYGTLVSYLERTARFFTQDSLPGLWVAILAAALAGALIELTWKRRPPLLLLWLAGPVALVVLHSIVAKHGPFPRNYLFIVPLIAVLGAHGVSLLGDLVRAPRGFALAAALSLSAVLAAAGLRQGTPPEVEHDNARVSFRVLAEHLQPGDWLAMDHLQMLPIQFYADREDFALRQVPERSWKSPIVQWLGGSNEPNPSSDYGRFFLLDGNGGERERLGDWLAGSKPENPELRTVWTSAPKDGERTTLYEVLSSSPAR